MNITKSAPLPERPCEQLTCCALCVCDPKHKHGNDSRYQAGGQCNYPLGSMPRCCNSFRSTRLIQVAKEVSPSAFAASSSCALNSSGSRIWYGGDRFSNGVDMVITLNYYSYMVITIVLTVIQKTTPRSGGSHTGRLTKPLIEVTIMAIKEHSLLFIHTQTPRKRNNPFHSSVLCTHPGGRFLPDLSRRGYLSTKSSRANFSGGTKRGAGGGIFVLVSSSSSLAQASDCLCRMISSSCVCVSCIGDSVLLVMILPCKAMRRSTSHHGADSDYSDSLALRRWRYSTSRFNAAVTNCPVLSPGIFTASTLFITSCGTLAATVCDFAFTAFVAMWCTPHKKQMQYAGKKISVQHLTCLTPGFKLVFNTLLAQGAETTKPGSALTLTGLLTTNDSESIEVAMRNHTTHPQGRGSHNLNKYIWRFIALSTAQPRVITIEATSEQEARQQSPAGCVMVFAARIRQGVGL